MGKLDNKVAIITGGNAGVGKEIIKLFANWGAKVVISARRQQVLEEAAKEIEEAGGTVLCVPTDISKVDDVKNLVSKTVETFGQLDILINNAGVLDKGLNAIDQIDYDDLNRVIDINQKGTMYCMSEALKVMKVELLLLISQVLLDNMVQVVLFMYLLKQQLWGNKTCSNAFC